MDIGGLILQTYNLAEYLLSNGEIMSRQTKKDSVSGIISVLDSHISGPSNQEEIARLKRLSFEKDFEDSDIYILTVSAIIKYCSVQIGECAETKQKLIERFGHLHNIQAAYHKRYPGTSDRFQGKGLIYSVITGGYDDINEPELYDGFDYVMLTDHIPDGYHGKWQMRIVDNMMNLPPNWLARYVKMHPAEFFPEYDFSVYIDGALKACGDFNSFISTYKKNSGIICFPHHSCNEITDEAEAIVDNKKAEREKLEKQIEKYAAEGYTGKGYMIETGCLVRDHNDTALMKVMDDWWNELCSYSHNRDQMSFDYVFWKNNYSYDLCDLPIYNNPWCVARVTH